MNTKTHKLCPRCKVLKPRTEYYKNKQSYCKSCTNDRLTERYREFKQACVDYKGSKCVRCGYDKCVAAIEFHHTDPSQKDFAISHHTGYILNDKVKAELDKCEVLCSNCHREEHFMAASPSEKASGLHPDKTRFDS